MSLQLRTRLGVSPAGRGRVWLSFHKDKLEFVESRFIDELHEMSDCAVYYDDFAAEETQINLPADMQLIIVLITANYLEASADRLKAMLDKARGQHIPVLPVLLEDIPIQQFEDIFGQIHFLLYPADSENLNPSNPEGAQSYRNKMSEMLKIYIVSNEMREKIISSFRKKIFLSYRKMDLEQAHELMRLIHESHRNLDVAIWHDEMLIAGEEFNDAIREELVHCDLFLLLVTPHVLLKADDGKDNYVISIEIPEAEKSSREILATEMLPMEEGWKEQLGLSEATYVNPGDVSSFCTERFGAPEIEGMPPEKKYLLGLAYLGGTLVERDPEIGTMLVKAAAQEGYTQAIREMKDRYFYGNGVPMDYEESYQWLIRLVEHLEPTEAILEVELSTQKYLDAGATDLAGKCAGKMIEFAKGMEQYAEEEHTKVYCSITIAKALSYLGDVSMRDGCLEDAVQYAQDSCSILESQMAYYNSQTNPLVKMMNIASEALVRETLSVNYDHLTDYLTRLGQVEEANLVVEKQLALFSGENIEEVAGGNPKEMFFACVRKADICEKMNDLKQAACWMEQAIRYFEEGWRDAKDWESRLKKATALNKLTGIYISIPQPDSERIQRIDDCITEAFDICEEILKYDPHNVSALRERTICHERIGCFRMRQGKINLMPQAFRQCEKERRMIAEQFSSELAQQDLTNIRDLIRANYTILWKMTYEQLADKHPHNNDASFMNLPFSMALQEERIIASVNGAGLYLIGSFLLTDDCGRDNFGRTYAVLRPMDSTRHLFPEPDHSPVVPVKSALRMFRLNYIGEGSNVVLADLGAEILMGDGIDKPQHTMILYHMVDDQYQDYFVLLFSLSVLEMKIAELCAAGILNPSAWLSNDGHFRIDIEKLKALIIMLRIEYFDKYILPDTEIANTPIRSVDPYRMILTDDLNDTEVDDSKGNGYYMFAIRI